MAKLNLPQLIEDLNTGHEIALALINRIDIAFEDLVANMSKEDHAFTSDDAARYYNDLYGEPKEYSYTNTELYTELVKLNLDTPGRLEQVEFDYIVLSLMSCPTVTSYKRTPLEVLIGMLDDGEDNDYYIHPRKEDYEPVK